MHGKNNGLLCVVGWVVRGRMGCICQLGLRVAGWVVRGRLGCAW